MKNERTVKTVKTVKQIFSSKIEELQFLSRKIKYQKSDGKVIGKHQGAQFYTIGQSKGLGIGGHKESCFIVSRDMENNILFVGEGKNFPGLHRKALKIENSEVKGRDLNNELNEIEARGNIESTFSGTNWTLAAILGGDYPDSSSESESDSDSDSTSTTASPNNSGVVQQPNSVQLPNSVQVPSQPINSQSESGPSGTQPAPLASSSQPLPSQSTNSPIDYVRELEDSNMPDYWSNDD